MSAESTNLTVSEAASYVAEHIGRSIHPSTIRRWCQNGLRDYDDEKVVLACTYVGGRRLISTEELDEFLALTVWVDECEEEGEEEFEDVDS